MRERTWKRKLGRLILRASIAGTIVVLLMCGWVLQFRKAQRERIAALEERIAVELDAIRAAGLPATIEELRRWYPHPRGPNGREG